MTDLVAQHTGLLNIETGELMPATITNAAAVLLAARDMKQRINDVVAAATAYLVDESAIQGTRTLHDGGTVVSLSGGVTDEYDAHDLMDLLRAAGCPESRIDEAVVATVTYKVNRSVLRQLSAANPDYLAAIELSRREILKPFRATVKEGAFVDDRAS